MKQRGAGCGGGGGGGGSSDTAAVAGPTVSTFAIPATSTSLTVPVTSFTGSDSTGVTGYAVTPSSTTPLSNSTAWQPSQVISFTFTTAGSKTLYAWVKNAAGQVSTSKSATVVITVPIAPNSLADLASTWKTSQGKPFTIDSSGNITGLVITTTNSGWCFPSSPNFDATYTTIQIQPDFSFSGSYASGRNTYGNYYEYAGITGKFAEASKVTISYSSADKAVGYCGDSGSGSVTATKD